MRLKHLSPLLKILLSFPPSLFSMEMSQNGFSVKSSCCMKEEEERTRRYSSSTRQTERRRNVHFSSPEFPPSGRSSSYCSSHRMSSGREFESVEKLLRENLPETELEQVWRLLYGKKLE